MPDRRPASRRGRGPTGPTRDPLPRGPVPIDTGTVEVQVDRGDPRSVTVLVNGVPSSPVHLDDPTRLDFEYLQVMAAVLDRLDPGPLDAVHLGAGACALPRWVEATRPGSRQLAIDVDGALLTLVRRWFDLPRSPRLRLRAGDARAVLCALPAASADVIVRDVFAGERTPVPLTTVEMVRQVVRVLRPGGLYLVNCADRPPLALARAELATLGGQMPEVALAVEPGILRGRRYGNLVLAATAEPPSSAGSVDRTSTRSASLLVDPGLARTLRSLPVPVRLLHGTELDAFVGRAVPLRDVPTTTEAAPP